MRDIARLPKGYSRLVAQHIDKLAYNPRPPDAKQLVSGGYSLRVGVYRVLYDITHRSNQCHPPCVGRALATR
jgi:mRNA-degrading endonuclease RelE of RelBE toxin-antitoxin system